MAINFPNSPTNGQQITEGNIKYVYNSAKGYWESSDASVTTGFATESFVNNAISNSSSTTIVADMAGLIALTGMSAGDQAYITANNKLYFYNGSGWYLIATVSNDSPSAITGVDGAYSLAIDGSPTTITAVSTDPEGFPLTWSYTTSGLGSIATVSNTNGVFTITPSTDTNNAGTFTLTISATDGINGAVNTAASITLNFILTVTNSRYTTLLATATSTGDNNDIIDSSPSGVAGTHTVTVNGDTHAGTFSPYRHGGYSQFMNDQRVEFTGVTISGSWTLEFWYQVPTNNPTTGSSLGITEWDELASMGWYVGSAPGYYLLAIRRAASNKFRLDYFGGGGAYQDSHTHTGDFERDTWYHLAVTYDSTANETKWYIDGTLVKTWSRAVDWTGVANVAIGQYRTNATTWNGSPSGTGYFKDFRFVDGAVIVPPAGGPTEALTAVSGTEILYANSPYIGDKSGASPTVSYSSAASHSLHPIAPFDNLEYDPTVHGGSVYFDGSSDYLSINDSSDFNFASGNGDFTIEWWMYKTNAEMGWLFSQRDGATSELGVRIDDGNPADSYSLGYVNIQYHSDTIQFNIDTKLNTWHHCAFVRTGTTIKWYTDGVLKDSRTEPASLANYSDPLYIGTWKSQSYLYQGYISDFRITNQNAVYNGNFTPPTAPLSSPNVGVLIKGTDASIIDKSQNVNLALYGNTTGSTTTNFTGAKSIYFDGTSGTYLEVPEIYASRWTGVWTLEFWIRTSSSIVDDFIIGKANSSGVLHILTMNSGDRLRVAFWGGPNIDSGSLSANTWYHVGIDFDGTTCTAFLDGSSFGSSTPTVNMTAGDEFRIGRSPGGSYGDFTGHIQDLRISLGKRRWSGSGNFPVPSGPLEG